MLKTTQQNKGVALVSFLTWMVMMRMSRAYGSSGVDRDFLWLCSLVTCIHFPLNSECWLSVSRMVTSSTLP